MSRAVAVPALVVPFPYDDAPAHATTGRAYGRSTSVRNILCTTYVCRIRSLANIIAPEVTGTYTSKSAMRCTMSAASVSSTPSIIVASKSTESMSGSSTGRPLTLGVIASASGIFSCARLDMID